MSKTTAEMSRRDWIKWGLAGSGVLLLEGTPALAAGEENLLGVAALRYRTDPERIARMLPPPLEPDDKAEVIVDYFVHRPVKGRENVFTPGPYYESAVHVSAKYKGHRGMLQLTVLLNQEWGRSMGRESVGWQKKEGAISLVREGNVVRASAHRRGKLLHRLQMKITDAAAHPLYHLRECGWGAFLYRYQLEPDWRQGPLAAGPVELWRLGGNDNGYPADSVEGPGYPRACDPAQTSLEFAQSAVLDPYLEFPVLEILGGSYYEGMTPARRVERQGGAQVAITGPKSTFLQQVDRQGFEPWSFLIYDRPIFAGQPLTAQSWPDKATAWKVATEEIRSYRQRPALELDCASLLDLQMVLDSSLHKKLLPPVLEPGSLSQARILAISAATSDFSPMPFSELWLLVSCQATGQTAWYALSHVVGEGGDVLYGRETFGYPSKTGDVTLEKSPTQFSVTGSRLDRKFFRFEAQAGKTNHAAVTEQWPVIGLRTPPLKPGMKAADVVEQLWSVSLTEWEKLNAAEIKLILPDDKGPGLVGWPEPWFELSSGRTVSARLGKGLIRRAPGKIIGVLPGFFPYVLSRFDGLRSGNAARTGDNRATFLVNP